MSATESVKCRCERCTCDVPEGEKFCSPYCESGVGQNLPDPCKCGHPDCEGTRSA